MVNLNSSGQFQNRGETFERPVVIKNIARKPPAKGPKLVDAHLMGSYGVGNSFLPYRFESRDQVGIKSLFLRQAETDLMEAVSSKYLPALWQRIRLRDGL